ncbi:hypothetical protein [Streptomyces sp. Tue6028]|uniref:hypothetical protein n=1 Tax=Streptomyces sp. Tue6028 TaxID=2036037 RepID=UPI003D74E87D
MNRKILGISAGAAAIGGLMLATPASASTSPPGGGTWDHVWTHDGATLSVEEHGDVIQLCDTAADGYSAKAYLVWNVSPGVADSMTLTVAGNGNCVGSDASTHDITEGKTVNVYISNTGPDSTELYVTYLNDN